jgi:hypothetical protein
VEGIISISRRPKDKALSNLPWQPVHHGGDTQNSGSALGRNKLGDFLAPNFYPGHRAGGQAKPQVGLAESLSQSTAYTALVTAFRLKIVAAILTRFNFFLVQVSF